MIQNKTALILIFISWVIHSCTTYNIAPSSFKAQMEGSNSQNQKKVTINNPLGYGNLSYLANTIDTIVAVDKKGETKSLTNSASMELRITHKNGKKYIMYFDTVILENDTLKGAPSRFLQKLSTQIRFDCITKIEIQDGRKKFGYQKPIP